MRVKICGLRRPDDARVAVRAGADAVGVILAPSPRRATLDDARGVAAAAREEAAALGREVEVWGVFVNESADRVAEIARTVPLDVAQLHGDETEDFARALVPFRTVKAVRVRGPESLGEIERLDASGIFEAILLDTYDERARGGTGKTFDWDVAAAAAERVRVVLAGGLSPSNVEEAVRRVRPWMVDASSGVERSPGEKDSGAVEAFVRFAKGALAGA
ncbi:MAG: phosphoribosylanthranilate isomerase [Planctomycetota bacterium]